MGRKKTLWPRTPKGRNIYTIQQQEGGQAELKDLKTFDSHTWFSVSFKLVKHNLSQLQCSKYITPQSFVESSLSK